MNQLFNRSPSTQPIRARGQGLVEFALFLPLLVLILFGVTDLGRAFHALIAVTNASREGARQGIFSYTTASPVAQITTATIREAAVNGITITPGNVTVTCNATFTSAPPSCPRYEPLRVRACFDFHLILQLFFPQTIPICRQTEMMIP